MRQFVQTSLISLISLFLVTTAFAEASPAPGNVLFILDGSGSMWGRVEGRHKIAIAKEVMTGLVRELPAEVRAGLQVYGHRSKGDCRDIETLVPIGAGNRDALVRQIEAITPRGKTPIAEAFRRAAEQLRALEDETTVVLVSDGRETCSGDPCELVRQLREQGIRIKVHVVGFDVARAESEQLICIAENGGGKYFSADGFEALRDALGEVRREVVAKVQAAQPPSKPATKVVEMQMPALGSIEIRNSRDHATIFDQRTGENKGFYPVSRGKPMPLPAGTYELRFPNLLLDQIELAPGERRVVDAAALFGSIAVANTEDHVRILDQRTGENKGFISATREDPVQVPVGIYKLRFPNHVLDRVEVRPGENRVIDANAVFGWIEIRNAPENFVIVDQDSGKRKGFYAASRTKPVQVPAGTYKLEARQFSIDDVVVGPGQRVVID